MPATPTLAQVNAAMAAVTAALNDMNIPDGAEDILNDLSNTLQSIQDAIIEKKEQDLVDALAADNSELQDLNQQICDLSDKLDSASETINKVSSTVGTIASIIGALV